MMPLLAQTETRTFYQASRLGAMDQWWHWLLLIGVMIAIILFVTSLYRRDGVELKRPTRWTLRLLRIAAFVGILIFFLKIEKRTEQKLVKNSRAIVLIDTSQSMGLADEDQSGRDASRIEQVAKTLGGGLIEEIQQQHDVVVYGFDQSDRPMELASLSKSRVDDADSDNADAGATLASKRGWSRAMYIVAIVFLVLAVVAVAAHLLLGYVVRNEDGESWALLVAIGCLIVAGVFYSVTNLRYPEIGWQQAFRGAAVEDPDANPDTDEADQPNVAPTVDWAQTLVPRGAETRLGDAIQFVIDKEQGGPIAGVTIFTDGNANAGVDFREAVSAAQDATIPIHLVGVGSSQRPTNARVVDIEAPAKVYPGDMFTIRGFIQAYGMSGKGLTVKLLSQPADAVDDEQVVPAKEGEQIVALGPEGEVSTVEFQVTPDEMGRRRYVISIDGAAEDLDDQDNEKSQEVEIVDRKNKVLLIAGGPTREYRFVRTLLHRDQDTKLHVLLQSSPEGAAQEADKVLEDLPTDAKDMFDYDCIVAFDADWEQFELEQVELLDRWVAEKAGGLILVAGPVNTPEWTTLRRDNRATNILKGLYPVTFFSRTVSRLARGQIARDANPVMMTAAGEQARFLWLDESPTQSKVMWQEFPGIYAAYPVRGLKPVATLYAELDKTNRSDKKNIFAAEQFYGSGRVFYFGSGELWRLRIQDPALFEQLYTKLVRHVSQGRLLRDSSRGVLMVGKDRCILGETITVRASLTDSQFRPLEDPTVSADLVSPDGVRKPLVLRQVKDAPRPGSYSGQFSATREGDYRIELLVPDSDNFDMLTSAVRVRVPQLEIESPQRNDAVMNEIASATGGTYFAGLGVGTTTEDLISRLIPQDQETYLPGTCLLYTSPSPRDKRQSRMPSSA